MSRPPFSIPPSGALRCLCWEGYSDGPLAELFRSRTGLGVSGEPHLSDDAAARRILAERGDWDVVNINTPFVRDVLHPAGAVVRLDTLPLGGRLLESVEGISAPLDRFKSAARSPDGRLLGIPQRFGSFNLVVNRNRLSVRLAQEQGFGLALEPDLDRRFGVLAYEDFNVMHIAIAAGLNPFEPMNAEMLAVFAHAAKAVFERARIVTIDHVALNAALASGDLDFYISGGTYTASAARLEGRLEICAVTPRRGPIDGLGAVAFVEINALLSDGPSPLAAREAFLEFIASDEGSVAAALAAGAANPVAQMGSPAVRDAFTADQLAAMQWDDVEEDLSHCADYCLVPNYAELSSIVRSSRQSRSRALS